MKKLLKYGVTSLTLVALGAVATATELPVIGTTVVRADEGEQVSYTVELVDKSSGQVLQSIPKTGVAGTIATIAVPKLDGYLYAGYTNHHFDSDFNPNRTEIKVLVEAHKTLRIFYERIVPIDTIIKPEQRLEYQTVFDKFHQTILEALRVYQEELNVEGIIYDENDLKKIFNNPDLATLHSELVLTSDLFDKPVGKILTDNDILTAIGKSYEYWDYQINYHKEITQKLETALANIKANKNQHSPANPKPTTPATLPTDNSGGTDVQDQTPPADNNTGGGTGAETTTPPTDSSTGGTGTAIQTPPAENSDQGSGSEFQTPPSDDEDNTSLTLPAMQADKEDLSATRNQLLAQVDKSRLTDEQKGELAVNIAFAETAEELDKLKAELTSLTVNQSAPASADKPATADKPAPSAAKTLPTTGELTTEALTAMGVSLVLFSLGLAKARKTK